MWETFLGALLGLISGIAIEALFHFISKNKSVVLLIEELQECYDMISLNENNFSERLVITIPVWEAVIQTGNLLLFTSNKYVKNLMVAYHHITQLQSAEKDGDILEDALKEKREAVLTSIKKLQNEKTLKKKFTKAEKRLKTE